MPEYSDDESSSDESGHNNEDDLKMKKLLAEWDERDGEEDGDLFVDSDDDSEDESDDENEEAKKKALLIKQEDDDSSDEEDIVSDDEKENFEKEPVVECVSSDEEESDEEEPVVTKKRDAKKIVVPESDDEEDKVIALPTKPTKDSFDDLSTDDPSTDDDDDDYEEPIVDTLKKKVKKNKVKKKIRKITEIEDDDDEEDKAMKQLLVDWDADMGVGDDDDDDSSDDDDDSEVSEREVDLEENVIDHIVLACDDLERALAEFEKKTGIGAQVAGTIKGLGIKCARISFADASYLEIIAPDPKGPGPIGELIKSKKIKELTPFHYAVRTRRAEDLKDEVGKFGYTPDHITMFGAKADGTPRKWEMLYLYGHRLGGICPFFINWANSDHPCATLPVVGKLKKVTVRAPEDESIHNLLSHVGVKGINIEEGKPKFSFSFQSPEGTVKFSTSKAVGFKFPGFEADVGAIPGDDGEQDVDVVFEDPKLPELLPVSDMDYDEIPEAAF